MKRYLTSVGVGLPISGVWGHRYFDTRRKFRTRTIRLLGLRIIVTSYLKSRGEAWSPR